MSITNDQEKFWELNQDNQSIYFKTPSRVEYGTWYTGDDTYKIGIGITNPVDAMLVIGDETETAADLPLLQLNLERPWNFGAGDTNGAGTSLLLYPEDNNKDFMITSTDWLVKYLRVRSNTVAADGFICLGENGSNVGIGTANPTTTLHIEGPDTATPPLVLISNTSEDYGGIRFADSSALTSQNFDFLYNSSSQDFKIRSDDTDNIMYFDYLGNIGIGVVNPTYQLQLSTDSAAKPTTSTWTIASDRRLKENIEDADLDICYNDIKNLPLRIFKWRDNYIDIHNVEDTTNLGFIAQEVELINKKAVTTKIDNKYGLEDFKSINKDQLIMSLFGAVKKLQNEVETMKIVIETPVKTKNYDEEIMKIKEQLAELKNIQKSNVGEFSKTITINTDEEVFCFNNISKGKQTRSKCGKIPIYIESLSSTKYLTVWD